MLANPDEVASSDVADDEFVEGKQNNLGPF